MPTPDEPSSAAGTPATEPLSQRAQRLRFPDRHGQDRNALRRRRHLLDEAARILDEIRLVEDDHRIRAALPRGHQISLDATRVEVAVEPGDKKDDVDVGGDDLLLGGIAGRPTREATRSRQHRTDARIRIGGRIDRNPVANRGKVRPRLRLVTQPSGNAGQQLAFRGQHAIDVSVLEADARRQQPRGPVFRERLVEASRPAEILERQHRAAVVGEDPRIQCSRVVTEPCKVSMAAWGRTEVLVPRIIAALALAALGAALVSGGRADARGPSVGQSRR